jgi:hypothetical protein
MSNLALPSLIFQFPAIMTLPSLLLGILVLLCCAILALQLWIISGRTSTPQAPPADATPNISLPPSQQGSNCSAGQSSPPTRTVSNPGRKCFRITNIPPDWSKDDLLESMRDLLESMREKEQSLGNFDGHVSLYPACCDTSSQTALLNLKKCPEFFQDIRPNSPKHIKCRGQNLDQTIVLSVDSDFYGLTPLNKPEGEIVAELVYLFAMDS